jgi:hypothetical protein
LHKYLLLFVCLFSLSFVFSQQGRGAKPEGISGRVLDSASNTAIVGASVFLQSTSDTSFSRGASSNEQGFFSLHGIPVGSYRLRVSYVGYHSKFQNIRYNEEKQSVFVKVLLTENNKLLKDAKVEGIQDRVRINEDTTEFNANAFKTNPDASAEDLVKKMPGITQENGEIKSGGESVKRVLVDGKEFFGDDASAALKNLPADIIDKVQVFDQQSDQSNLSGFNDGNTSKTLNIVTKTGKNNGNFGKIYAGYGQNNRYVAGGNVNVFAGKRRISFIGLSNNINRQNFASEDLLGVTGGSTGRGGRQMPGQGMGDFFVGQNDGITQAHAVGINYSDQWKKTSVSMSYFFNQSINTQQTELQREIFLRNTANQSYSEFYKKSNTNNNHRLNGRFVTVLDSNQSLIFTPRYSLQGSISSATTSGVTAIVSSLLNQTSQELNSQNLGVNLSNDLSYRKKLNNKGRSLTLSANHRFSNRDYSAILDAQNIFEADSILNEQESKDINISQTFGLGVSLTEPLGKKGMIQLSYNPSLESNTSDKKTKRQDPVTEAYSITDSLLSSTFENTIQKQNIGTSYRYSVNKNTSVTLGINYQYSMLQASQDFPTQSAITNPFHAFLPSAMLQFNALKFRSTIKRFFSPSYLPKDTSSPFNLRINYRSSSRLPSLQQLQPVVNNTNPLLLQAGNPLLEQEIQHRVFGRLSFRDAKKGTSFFVFSSFTYLQDFMGQNTTIATQDSSFAEGVWLNRGMQISKTDNLSGNYSSRTFATYSIPLKKAKSTLNLNTGYVYSQTPGLINNQKNFTYSNSINAGTTWASNISENLDFTLNYTLNYFWINYTFRPNDNNNYFTQNGSFRLNWMPWKGLVINSETYYNGYAGLGDGFNQNVVLWNGGIGYKFLKDRRGDLRITVFDLLGQNNSIQRNVTENYIEDVQTVVLNRFFMLHFTYQFRHFGKPQERQKGTSPNFSPSNTPAGGMNKSIPHIGHP